jgi:hypothetical protein
LANYTFSKSLDEESAVVSTGGASFSNPYSRRYDRGLSDFDHTHRFVTSFLWSLPQPANAARAVKFAIGGWQINGVVTLQSGTPFSVLDGTDQSLDGVGADRANLAGDPHLDTSRPRGDLVTRYFNTAAFQVNPLGTYGSSGRNIVRGPGYADVDMSVFKNFPIHERLQLQYRTEFFNLLNRPNLNNPNNSLISPLYGRITGANSPRILQLALRLVF